MSAETDCRALKSPLQRGRNAMLIHAFALWVALATFLLARIGETSELREWTAFAGLGFAATVVLALWSVSLALRAFWNGEPWRGPAIVLALFLFEAAALCLPLWSDVLDGPSDHLALVLGLPVFVPFFTLATFVAVPLACWRARRAEAKAVSAGLPSWTRRARWKHGAAWYGVVVLLLSLTLLPWPLFIFCAFQSTKHYEPNQPPPAWSWRTSAADHMPNLVRDSTEWIADKCKCPQSQWERLQNLIMWNGQVSKERLLRSMRNKDKVFGAINGLWLVDPEDALRIAENLILDDESEQFHYCGVKLLAERGSSPQVERLLRMPKSFRGMILNHLASPFFDRPELVPVLDRFIRTSTDLHSAAIKALLSNTTAADTERLCLEYLKDGDPLRRRDVIAAIHAYDLNDEFRFRIALAGLADPHPTVRKEALRFQYSWFATAADTKRSIEWHERVAASLDDPDLLVRREAMWNLQLVENGLHHTPQPDAVVQPATPEEKLLLTILDRKPAPPPETPEEIEERDKMKAAVEKWLKEHKP